MYLNEILNIRQNNNQDTTNFFFIAVDSHEQALREKTLWAFTNKR